MRQAPFSLSTRGFIAAVIVIVSLVAIGVGATLVTAHATGAWSDVVGPGDVAAASAARPHAILGIYQSLIEEDETTANDRERDLKRLSTYGWVDRSRGVVHIPIDRAMQLVAREGL
jgi:hypothetical protein